MSDRKSLWKGMRAAVKRLLGIQDFPLFRRNLRRHLGRLFYHKKYTAQDLVRIMQEMGMKAGSLVCIHASMKAFYNYCGTAEELIDEILRVIGSEGTLMMPAFPDKKLIQREGYIFDPLHDRTGAGYLAETFRKHPGVMRSISVQHSVCAIGRHAAYLTGEHQCSKDCWDGFSPWQRSVDLGALVFNFGLPRSYIGTFQHCVESRLQEEHPYWAQFFSSTEHFRYYDAERRVCSYTNKVSRLERVTRKRRVTRSFTSEEWQIRSISNLEIKVFYTARCFPKMLELGRCGICIYKVPSPKRYRWRPV